MKPPRTPLINPELQPKSVPAALGYRMPAEWVPHKAAWLSWPHNQETWPARRLGEVQEIYLQILEALLPGEKVHLLVSGERQEEEVETRLRKRRIDSRNLLCHLVPTVDAWIRDYGPTFLTLSEVKSRPSSVIPAEAGIQDLDSRLTSCGNDKLGRSSDNVETRNADSPKAWCKWMFNAWGQKYSSRMKDTEIFKKYRDLIPYPCFEVNLVLEGGSIEVNGEGVCLTTEQCLLNPNRNPRLSRPEIEQYLKDYLGVSHIVWLSEGLVGDDTDGHIDDIARFASSATLLVAYEKDEFDENHSILKKNWAFLEDARSKLGTKWDLIKLPMPGKVIDEGVRLPASYANFYIANEAVLLPIYNHPHDSEAVSILKELFPGRRIIPIACNALVYGLGSIHCVTQQEPL